MYNVIHRESLTIHGGVTTGMMVVVSSHPRPRNLNTPEQYVTDLLQMKVNEGVTMDAEALFEIFDMLEMDDLKAPRVLQIMEYARLKVGISFDDFNMYLEEAGVTSQDPGKLQHYWRCSWF